MPLTINIYDAKTSLSQLVERASAGEEIIIAKAGRPMARLAPLRSTRTPNLIGALAGQIEIGPDFDAPLPEDIMAAFRGEDS
jgi:prevent-host-death family protein